jgi:Fe-S-cluster containining protein
MTRLERDRIETHLGDKLVDHMDLACPVLNDAGRCSAYAVRPLICRLWGMVKMMRCPHGCEPSRWLTDDEAKSLLTAVAAIGGDTVMFGLDESETTLAISEAVNLD